MLKTKSVHSDIAPGDGLRILATRFRGRGLPTDRYDVWMANLGPSEKLLKSVLAKKISWREFLKKYREEMFAPAATDAANATECHRFELQKLIERECGAFSRP